MTQPDIGVTYRVVDAQNKKLHGMTALTVELAKIGAETVKNKPHSQWVIEKTIWDGLRAVRTVVIEVWNG